MTEHLVVVAALVIAGYLLLALEIFVIPGVGAAGVGGLLCLVGGCFLALRWWEGLQGALVVALVVGTTTAFFIWVPRTRYGRHFMHRGSLADARAGESALVPGQMGLADSDLRPSGIGRFGKLRESVVTDGGFISSGAPIRVITVAGSRIVVESAPKGANGGQSEDI